MMDKLFYYSLLSLLDIQLGIKNKKHFVINTKTKQHNLFPLGFSSMTDYSLIDQYSKNVGPTSRHKCYYQIDCKRNYFLEIYGN